MAQTWWAAQNQGAPVVGLPASQAGVGDWLKARRSEARRGLERLTARYVGAVFPPVHFDPKFPLPSSLRDPSLKAVSWLPGGCTAYRTDAPSVSVLRGFRGLCRGGGRRPSMSGHSGSRRACAGWGVGVRTGQGSRLDPVPMTLECPGAADGYGRVRIPKEQLDGSPTWIRTTINRVRVCCPAVRRSGSRPCGRFVPDCAALLKVGRATPRDGPRPSTFSAPDMTPSAALDRVASLASSGPGSRRTVIEICI